MNEHLYKFIDEKGSQHLMLHENGLWTKIEWQCKKRRGESRVIGDKNKVVFERETLFRQGLPSVLIGIISVLVSFLYDEWLSFADEIYRFL